jgi:hypothetical protein
VEGVATVVVGRRTPVTKRPSMVGPARKEKAARSCPQCKRMHLCRLGFVLCCAQEVAFETRKLPRFLASLPLLSCLFIEMMPLICMCFISIFQTGMKWLTK